MELHVTRYEAGLCAGPTVAAPGRCVGTLFLAWRKDDWLGQNKYAPKCLWCGKAIPSTFVRAQSVVRKSLTGAVFFSINTSVINSLDALRKINETIVTTVHMEVIY